MHRIYRTGLASLLAVVLASATSPRPAAAQTVEELEANAHRLSLLLEEATAEVRRLDSLAEVAAQPVTFTVGTAPNELTLTASARYRTVVETAARDALNRLSERLGEETRITASLPLRVTITGVVTRRDRATGFARSGLASPDSPDDAQGIRRWRLNIDAGPFSGVAGATLYSTDSIGVMSETIEAAIARGLFSSASDSLRRWAPMGTLLPANFGDGHARAYRQLVETPHSLVGPCILGDFDACRRGLGLQPTDDPLTDWYDGADLRTRVAAIRSPVWRTTAPDLWRLQEDCLAGSDDACRAVMEARHFSAPPFPASVRKSYFATVLDLGGARGIRRLLQGTGDLESLLAHAAGTDPDNVMREWHGRMLATAGRPTTVSTRSAVLALLWCAGFATIAMRSTRWR